MADRAPVEVPLPLYQPSGRIDLRGWLVLLGAGPLVTALLGWAYAYFVSPQWHPAFRALSVVVAAVLTGFAGVSLMTAARSRRPTLIAWLGAVIGLAVLGIHWVFVIASVQGWPSVLALASSPWELPRALATVANTYQFRFQHASPGWQFAGWLVESVLVVGLCAAICKDQGNKPFSEVENAWAERHFDGELFAFGAAEAELRSALVRSGVDVLLNMQIASAFAAPSLAEKWWTVRVQGHWVQADEQARWLEIAIVIHTRDATGKIKSAEKTVAAAWQVSAKDFDAAHRHLTQDPSAKVEDPATPVLKLESETPVELQAAVAALQGDNFSSAYTLAQAHRQHPHAGVQADAVRLCALALARQGRWAAALEEFHRLFAIESTVHNALQLATTSVMAGELLRGQAWFEKAQQLNGEAGVLEPPKLHMAFFSALTAAGEHAACLAHVNWLAEAYKSLGVTDSHFLWMRGLPSFEEFLVKSAPVLEATLPGEDSRAWYQALRVAVDDDGKAAIDGHLAPR